MRVYDAGGIVYALEYTCYIDALRIKVKLTALHANLQFSFQSIGFYMHIYTPYMSLTRQIFKPWR